MTAEWRGPFWLKPFFAWSDDTIFHRVTSVQLTGRDVPDALLKFQYLESLGLKGCRVSSAQLQQLRHLSSLKSLSLDNNHIAERASTPPVGHAWAESRAAETSPCLNGSSIVAMICPSDPR